MRSEERRKVFFFVQRSELFLKVDCFVPENFAQLLLYSLVDQRFSPFVYAYLILIFYQTFYSILKLALLSLMPLRPMGMMPMIFLTESFLKIVLVSYGSIN